ncbi:MAG: glycosidase, partial [Chloroflexota bacterium]|nr:glycosidase [Chloroflexota bacterium]
AIALIHRPTVAGSRNVFVDPWWGPRTKAADEGSTRRLKHPSVWMSYSRGLESLDDLCSFQSHHRLLSPRQSWERVKVGGGAPPLLTLHGWLLVYHGVAYRSGHFRYSAGAALLDADNPQQVLYRTSRPILSPGADDQLGVVPDVVFPTAIDQRTDLGLPNRVDVYYGMADSRIGVAGLTLPRMVEVNPPRKSRPSISHPVANPAMSRRGFPPG